MTSITNLMVFWGDHFKKKILMNIGGISTRKRVIKNKYLKSIRNKLIHIYSFRQEEDVLIY